MTGRYEQAELLVALWTLGAPKNPKMPTSHGLLDRALAAVKDKLPSALGSLTFSATGVGLRCYELPEILLAAQEAMLTSEPNPTYLTTVVSIEEGEAEELAVLNGLSLKDARALGGALHAKVEELKAKETEPPLVV